MQEDQVTKIKQPEKLTGEEYLIYRLQYMYMYMYMCTRIDVTPDLGPTEPQYQCKVWPVFIYGAFGASQLQGFCSVCQITLV